LSLPPSSLRLLAKSLFAAGEHDEAVVLLRWGRSHHPTSFWMHYDLGIALVRKKSLVSGTARSDDPITVILDQKQKELTQAEVEEAIGCYRAALALRPSATSVHHHLGIALSFNHHLDDAIDEFLKAIVFDPKSMPAHTCLGSVLSYQGQLKEAETEYRMANELDPKAPYPL